MPYKEHRTCPLCDSVMLNLSDHLSKVHDLTRQQRQPYLKMTSGAKLSHHERTLRELHSHLERGTFPNTLRLKSFPKMKTPQGQALVHEACQEVQKIMLIQMVEEQKQALAQAQKEVKNCPLERIKSLRKEIKSLRAQLKLQTIENQVNRRPMEDTSKPNSTEIET